MNSWRAPGQRTYELIRPVVLFGQSPAERAAKTSAAVRTVYRQIARFEQLGLAGLAPPPKVDKYRGGRLRSARRSSTPIASTRNSTPMT